jgi:hypothetical protein
MPKKTLTPDDLQINYATYRLPLDSELCGYPIIVILYTIKLSPPQRLT